MSDEELLRDVEGSPTKSCIWIVNCKYTDPRSLQALFLDPSCCFDFADVPSRILHAAFKSLNRAVRSPTTPYARADHQRLIKMAPVAADTLLHILKRAQNPESVKHSNNAASIAVGVIIPLLVLALIAFVCVRLRRHPHSRLHKWLRFQNSSSTTEKAPSIPASGQKQAQRSIRKLRLPPRSAFKKPQWLRLSTPPPQEPGRESSDSTIVERERPATTSGKYWTAEDINVGKINSRTMSLASRVTRPAPSIFSTKSHLISQYPKPQRPSSRHVKTTSKHISAQFLDWGTPLPNSQNTKVIEAPIPEEKRNSKSVITDLAWQQYEPSALRES